MIRQVQVRIGPFKDYEKKGTKSAIVIDSNGLSSDLRIDFSVNKHITGSPNETQLTLTNLSQNTRNALQQQGLSVELYGGYVGQELNLISKGGILAAPTQRAGSEIVTTIYVMDGMGASLRSFYNKSYTGSIAVSTIIKEIAEKMEGVTIGEINVTGKLANKGRIFNGRAIDSLDSLARAFGFSWSIQNNVFQAIDDDKSSKKLYSITPEDNLISISPLLNGVIKAQVGVQIETVLNPKITPGDTVKVTSNVSPNLNGKYVIDECQIGGSTHGSDWKMSLKSLKRF